MEKINYNKTEFTHLVSPYYKDALDSLTQLLEIRSILDEKTQSLNKPFGDGVDRALEYVYNLGKRLSFKVDRCDNYITELIYGDGDKTLDIYAHVDVVPVKESSWSSDPFKVRIKDDVIYARGSSDDKGPGIACLYALKALMDNNMLKHHRIRFLFGGNEENGSLCLDHYFNTMHKDYPTFGFSPDADYPLIYGEKSIYNMELVFDCNIDKVSDFSLGSAFNIVLDEANVSIKSLNVKDKLNDYLKNHLDVKGEYENNNLHLIGKPAHGSTPWKGVNAGLHLLNLLSQITDNAKLKEIYDMFISGTGESFSGNYKDKYFTESSYNIGKIKYENGKLTLYLNVRFPSSINIKDVVSNLECKTKGKAYNVSGSDGFVSDPDSKYLKILLKSYRQESNDYISKPQAIGGGTYARESKNSVAFGAQFPNRDYKMHGDDEFFPIDDFYLDMQIYARAIYELSQELGK